MKKILLFLILLFNYSAFSQELYFEVSDDSNIIEVWKLNSDDKIFISLDHCLQTFYPALNSNYGCKNLKILDVEKIGFDTKLHISFVLSEQKYEGYLLFNRSKLINFFKR